MIKIKPRVFLLMMCFVYCLGCSQKEMASSNIIKPKCILSQNSCSVKMPSGVFSILFNVEPVLTESPFDIQLILKGQPSIINIKAHMEGKNMYMGKIPLFFESQQGVLKQNNKQSHYTAKAFVGSCSESEMRWVLFFEIELENAKNEMIIEHFSIEFNSYTSD